MAPLYSIRAGVVLALSLVLGMGLFSVHVVKSFERSGDWVLHTNQVQLKLEVVLSLIRQSESNSRGYILTGNEDFLTAFSSAQVELRQAVSDVRSLTKDNPRQQARLEVLGSLLAEKIAVMAQGVELRRRNGLVSASDYIATAGGKRLMDALRDQIVRMQKEESDLLSVRLGQVRHSARMGMVALAAGLLMALLLLLTIFALIFRDRREREQAAAALKKSSEQVRDFYNRAPCGYHSLDANGVYVAINDTELSWLGYTREEIQGKMRFSDLLTEDGRKVFTETFPRFKEQGTVHDLEFEIRRKDGSTFPVLLNATALVDAKGRYLASRSTMFDLTARAEADKVVQKARMYAESIVDTVREPLVILTPDLHVNSASRSFYQMFQTTPDATEGRLLAELGNGMWAIPELLQALAAVVPQQSTINDFEVDREFPRLGRKVMVLNARTLYLPGNQAPMLLLAIEDATARKQAMEELESFSYSVSHDLRAPLRHIDGFAGMLRSQLADSADAEVKHYIDVIMNSARRMSMLIDDLLAFSRVGRTELRRLPLDLNSLVCEVMNDLKVETAGRVIEWVVSPLPPAEGDRGLITQVFANLLGNAVKYTRRRASARIEIIVVEKGPEEVVLCVRDNGAGFDMRYVDKLFGMFQRLHSGAEFEGTGVGLALVRRIIQRHGGRIWAEGAVDVGASIYFSLPCPH